MENRERAITEALEVLSTHLKDIERVSQWAEFMGYNDTVRFSRLFRNYFRKTPKSVMDNIKLDKAIELLTSPEDLSCYEVAWEIGKRDEHALFHFVKRMTGRAPTDFSSRKPRTYKYC